MDENKNSTPAYRRSKIHFLSVVEWIKSFEQGFKRIQKLNAHRE